MSSLSFLCVFSARVRTWAALACVAAGMAGPALAADVPEPPHAQPLQPIPSLDLPRYMGRWHEIARFPNWFQKDCAGDSSADYQLNADGTVQVLNRCRLANGEFKEALGQARRVGAPGSPRLQVRFAPAWLSFIPAVWGDYWVVDLDPAYQLVAVTEPRREYLWVLARSPQVREADYRALLERLRAQGLDVARLQQSSPFSPEPAPAGDTPAP